MHLEGVDEQEEGGVPAILILDESIEGPASPFKNRLCTSVLLVDLEPLIEAEAGADVAAFSVGFRPVARPGQQRCQSRNVVRQTARAALTPVGDPMSRRVDTREQRHVRRRRLGRLAERLFEEDSLTRQPTDLRAGGAFVSVGCQMIRPQRVDRDQHQIGSLRIDGFPARPASGRKPHGCQHPQCRRSQELPQDLCVSHRSPRMQQDGRPGNPRLSPETSECAIRRKREEIRPGPRAEIWTRTRATSNRKEGRHVLPPCSRSDHLGGLSCPHLRPCSPPSGIQGEQILEAAKTGRLDRVRKLASADPDLFQARDVAGYSALRWAAIRGNSEVVRLLAENGADPNSVAADGGTSRMVRLIMMTRR